MNRIPFSISIYKISRLLFLLIFLIACGLPEIVPTSTGPTPTKFTDHIIVSLTELPDGESYPISAGLSVRGEAISDGSIARMELWVDGELYETYTAPESDLGLLVHYWDWSPRTLGMHTLGFITTRPSDFLSDGDREGGFVRYQNYLNAAIERARKREDMPHAATPP